MLRNDTRPPPSPSGRAMFFFLRRTAIRLLVRWLQRHHRPASSVRGREGQAAVVINVSLPRQPRELPAIAARGARLANATMAPPRAPLSSLEASLPGCVSPPRRLFCKNHQPTNKQPDRSGIQTRHPSSKTWNCPSLLTNTNFPPQSLPSILGAIFMHIFIPVDDRSLPSSLPAMPCHALPAAARERQSAIGS